MGFFDRGVSYLLVSERVLSSLAASQFALASHKKVKKSPTLRENQLKPRADSSYSSASFSSHPTTTS